MRSDASTLPEKGTHRLKLLADHDHYACVTGARDHARTRIVIGCDLWGLAAETSVLVPMERAAELGRRVHLMYQRPSKRLSEEGRIPDADVARKRGLFIEQRTKLHGKFLLWDQEALAVTSFNWMSTVVDGARAKSAELGVLIEGPGLGLEFARKLLEGSGGAIGIDGMR